MKHVLVAGAGKSSYFLINYLLQHAAANRWHITVTDGNLEAIEDKIDRHPCATAAPIDITQDFDRKKLVAQSDLVVSLMPPHLHVLLAKDCLDYKKPIITASYVSPEMRELDKKAKELGLMFMCELGLDPGIDHMTAAAIFDSIRRIAGTITSFKSYCGGLVAPESDDNAWHYKFSWNPRNVVLAGMGGATFIEQGAEVFTPYEQLFNPRQLLHVPGNETLSWYANRDSRPYADVYDLHDADTLIRATLRHPDFMLGWNAVIALGLTELQKTFPTEGQSYRQWLAHAMGMEGAEVDAIKKKASALFAKSEGKKILSLLDHLGVFSPAIISGHTGTAYADILLSLLIQKWNMQPSDKDRVVMHHEVEYFTKRGVHRLSSSMTLIGENKEKTAMAKTVGMPMAILTKLYLQQKIKAPSGVLIPVMPEIYRPVLRELEREGIIFTEHIS